MYAHVNRASYLVFFQCVLCEAEEIQKQRRDPHKGGAGEREREREKANNSKKEEGLSHRFVNEKRKCN